MPDRIGPYRIEELIGKGGMGEVYRGFDDRLERPVALKRVRPGRRPSAGRRLRREAKMVARLRHEAIVRIHDWVEDGAALWIVMELVNGRSLRVTLAEDGPLAPAVAASVARRIAEGLRVAHSAGMVHRDLKPDNIMLTPEGGVRILDFGLVKPFEGEPGSGISSISTAGQILGTVSYMSPEQALGEPLDDRSDLFSLGTLLYEMIAGEPPFRSPRPLETLDQVCNTRQVSLVEQIPGVSRALSDLVNHLLEKEPRRRPGNAQIVAETLASLEGTLSATAAPPIRRPGRPDDAEASSETQRETHISTEPPRRPANARPRERDRFARGTAMGLALGSIAALAIAFAFFQNQTPDAPGAPPLDAPLQVAVPPAIALATDGETPTLEAGAVQAGVLRALLGLRATVAVEPTVEESRIEAPDRLARALGVDEVVRSEVRCAGESCQVTLKRFRGPELSLEWVRAFTSRSRDLLELSGLVADQLRGGFPERSARDGGRAPEVDPALYASYLELSDRYWRRDGGFDAERLFAELATIQDRAPRFLDAHRLEAWVARARFVETRDPASLERARAALERARALAPDDPRVLKDAAQILLDAGDLDAASRALDELEAIEPGDAGLLALRARAAERRGDLDEARQRMAEAATRRPSWRQWLRLADLAQRTGDLDGAREAVDRALARWPENAEALSRAAQLELLSGDLERAVSLYERLVERSPETTELSNLGLAHLLLGRHDAAAHAFRRALERSPDSPHALLNLADAENLRGAREEARRLYQRVIDRAEVDPDPESLATIRAQALAHLGRRDEARRTLAGALSRAAEDPMVRYEAAIVHAVIGEVDLAREHAVHALESGIERRWFEIPFLDGARPF